MILRSSSPIADFFHSPKYYNKFNEQSLKKYSRSLNASGNQLVTADNSGTLIGPTIDASCCLPVGQ